MNKTKYIISAAVVSLCGSVYSAALNIADYCDPKTNAPKSIKDMTPLADGLSYAAVSDDKSSIDVYSYKTGEKISTLFSINDIKGDNKISDFEGYILSANEKKILLWNNSTKIYRHSFTADYYVYDILRHTIKPVTDKGAIRGAVISHDGRMVAYTHANNLYVANLDYGTDVAVTADGEVNKIIYGVPDWSYEEEFGINNTIRWSNDDITLAFMKFDESEVPTYGFDQYKSFCDKDPMSDLYPSRYNYKYPLPGYPNCRVNVLAYNLDTRVVKTMDLEIGEKYVPSMEFDGSGTNLMVMTLNRDQNDLKLYRVNPASTVAHEIMTETATTWLSPSAYQMVKYGVNSFVIASDRSGYRHLYEYDYNGNMLRQLSKGDWNITDYYGCDKAGVHYAQATVRGAINRNVISINSKGAVKVLNDIDGTESADFNTNFTIFVRKYSSATVPPQYSLCNAAGSKIKDLELNEEYARKYAAIPKKEFLKVPNAEGVDMNAFIIYPENFDPSRKYPVMMYQYNGPESQLVLNRWGMDGIYYIASQGYIVAVADGRGTGNRDAAWTNVVYRKLGQYETADQLAAAKYFSQLPYVDGSKMACFGWSYGGYMTLMEMTDSASPFKAGIAMAPVSDWHFYDSIYTERFMQTPGANPKGYKEGSAVGRASNIKGRLLIMSGTNDDNVHFLNTLMFSSKLNSEARLFDMMVYSGFEHSLGMCNARVALYNKIVDFLNTQLK